MAECTTIEVLRSAQSFESLANEWSGFSQVRHDPLLSHPWFAAMLESDADAQAAVIAIRSGSRLVAAAPFVETRSPGVRRLEFIGAARLYEPADLIAADSSALTTLCESIVAMRLPVVLQRIPAGGATEGAFRRSCRRRGWVIDVQSPPVLLVEFSTEWHSYLASRSRSVRSNFLKRRRRLEASGPVSYESVVPTDKAIDHALTEALDVEADGWKGRSHSAALHNPRILGFLKALARRLATTGTLRFSFLRVAGQAVAMSIALQWNRRLWGIKKGYRESWQHFSPGMLLLAETITDASSCGVEAFEFLGSGDHLQSDWANGSRKLLTLAYYPYSMRGILALAGDVIAKLLRGMRG